MAFLRNKVTIVAAVGMLGVGGWYLSTVLAAQAQGALAQAPLNDRSCRYQPPTCHFRVAEEGKCTALRAPRPRAVGGATTP